MALLRAARRWWWAHGPEPGVELRADPTGHEALVAAEFGRDALDAEGRRLALVMGGDVVAHVLVQGAFGGKDPVELLQGMRKAGVSEAALRQVLVARGIPDNGHGLDHVLAHGELPPGWAESGPVTMAQLVVLPRYRGLGLGKALAVLAARDAFQRGHDEVQGMAASEALRPFYASLGAASFVGATRAMRISLTQGLVEGHLAALPPYVRF